MDLAGALLEASFRDRFWNCDSSLGRYICSESRYKQSLPVTLFLRRFWVRLFDSRWEVGVNRLW